MDTKFLIDMINIIMPTVAKRKAWKDLPEDTKADVELNLFGIDSLDSVTLLIIIDTMFDIPKQFESYFNQTKFTLASIAEYIEKCSPLQAPDYPSLETVRENVSD